MAEAGGLAGVRKGMAVSGGSRLASVGRPGRGENRTEEVEISPCIVSLRCVRQRCTAVLSKDGKRLDRGSGVCVEECRGFGGRGCTGAQGRA